MHACRKCHESAEFAVHALVSTKGVSPRHQKCSEAIPLCGDCLSQICSGRALDRNGFGGAVYEAYAAINERLAGRAEARHGK
jgi:hypothetical protein